MLFARRLGLSSHLLHALGAVDQSRSAVERTSLYVVDCYGRPNRADHYILPCDFYLLSSFFFSSPNLGGRRLDVYHTSTHGVALVRI